MLTSELDYHLPSGLIAQRPVVPRDHSRLLIYNRSTESREHRRLPDLLSHLNPGDALVYNDSRVLRARVHVVKPTGGKVELLFLQRRRPGFWEALVRPSARLREGITLGLPSAADDPEPSHETGASHEDLKPGAIFTLKENLGSGRWLVKNMTISTTESLLEQIGEMPLPPYIRERPDDPERYQTVYASEPGSAAAPTAGLHFTQELIERIRSMGVSLLPLTLHIGLDTFRPVSEDDLGLHVIHSEHYNLPLDSYEEIVRTKERGGKVVAVGTTAVRVIETVFQEPLGQLEGETRLFITPGFDFRVTDALLTNFHLPKSTLLALVMAFAGVDEIRSLYAEAVREKYRFFSFGDAMLLL
ncbi:MAG: tRNA preQ1(34) S-adenosylmethionine ribosyltransferase-isomerase QueA [Thermoleophilia bacterium]|nr:tRNA preQ1(34) S-adenosylmethionine ribosyltransferase-isomerase QueA [Thermoleophilia bacterium]